MARILITGANGFAGPYVAAALAARGHELHGLSRFAVADDGAIGQWHVAELTDAAATARAVQAARPEAVIHLAAISFVAHSDVADIYASNVVGTRNLLQALADFGPLPGPTILASSANIYGNRVGGALHEGLPPSPQSDYALSKVACEYLADIYAERVRSLVIRPFNYTGRGQSVDFVIPKIIDHVRRGTADISLGNLKVARDFSDVRFFAEAVARLLEADVPAGERINICSGAAHTLTEVLDLIADVSGHRLHVTTDPAFVRTNEVDRLWGDPTKLQRLIGPIAGPRLEETLRWMLEA